MENKYWWILGIILLVLFMNQSTTEDKKEGMFSLGTTLAGVALLFALGVIMMTSGVGAPLGIALLVGGVFLLGTGITGLFAPTPTIPVWGWIAGFVVLLFVIKGKKK